MPYDFMTLYSPGRATAYKLREFRRAYHQELHPNSHKPSTSTMSSNSSSSSSSSVAPADQSYCVTEGNIYHLATPAQEVKCFSAQGRRPGLGSRPYPTITDIALRGLNPELHLSPLNIALVPSDYLFQCTVQNLEEMYRSDPSRVMSKELHLLLMQGLTRPSSESGASVVQVQSMRYSACLAHKLFKRVEAVERTIGSQVCRSCL
jgi:hypothetical protein